MFFFKFNQQQADIITKLQEKLRKVYATLAEIKKNPEKALEIISMHENELYLECVEEQIKEEAGEAEVKEEAGEAYTITFAL